MILGFFGTVVFSVTVSYEEADNTNMLCSNYCAQVEANDAVTVASMTRPKLLPNEALSDLAVSAATKLQCYRVNIHLSSFS